MAIQSIKELNKAIKTLGTNANKFRGLVHSALISCAYHSAKDGQITPFNDLLKAVGNGTRTKGIVLWAETYGYVQLKNGEFINNKASREGLSVTCEADFAEQVQIMNTNPHWADIVPKEVNVSIFDQNKYLLDVLARITAKGDEALVPFLETAISLYKTQKAIKELASNDVVAEVLVAA